MDRLNKPTGQDHAKTSARGIAVDDERSRDAQQLQHQSRGESHLEASKAVATTTVHWKATRLRAVCGALMTP